MTPSHPTPRTTQPPCTTAVILAGGTGSRMGADVPKQLLRLGARTILEHSVAAFEASPVVDEIIVMMAADHLDEARSLLAGHVKVRAVEVGGATRDASTRRALALLDDGGLVLVHDAARPLVTQEVIARVAGALADHEAVTPAVRVADTIVEARGGVLVRQVPRDDLWRVQTPQGFAVATLRAAYAVAAQDPEFVTTDDAGVVARHLPGIEVAVVEGDETNLKITRPGDITLATRLMEPEGPVTAH